MKSITNQSIMKTFFAKRLGRTVAVAGCLAWPLVVSSCQTTGDPSTGGIFWSEHKAQDRLDERQNKLNRIDDQTTQAKKSANAKQREANRLKQAPE